jgi:hypothetical protein
MAKKQTAKRARAIAGLGFVKTLSCLTILTACMLLIIGGVDEGVRTSKIIYTCLAVSAGIGFAFWAVIRAVGSYEEIDGG